MANSLGKLWICALALGSSALAAQDRSRDSTELVFDMQSFELDGKTNLIKLSGPRIAQGEMNITADEALATSIDVEAKSEWRLTGHVKITLKTAVIMADTAVFTFNDKRLARGELGGQTTFEDVQTDGKTPIRGGAGKVVYDYTIGTLRLTNQAWIHKGNVEARGCDLIYTLGDKGVKGTSDCEDRFQIRVLPQQGENAAAEAPPP